MNASSQPKPTETPASRFFEAAEGTMINLAQRWADERDFEDIEDYHMPLAPIAAKHGCAIVKMLRRPFGCEFTTDQGSKRYKITVSLSGIYSYKRIA